MKLFGLFATLFDRMAAWFTLAFTDAFKKHIALARAEELARMQLRIDELEKQGLKEAAALLRREMAGGDDAEKELARMLMPLTATPPGESAHPLPPEPAPPSASSPQLPKRGPGRPRKIQPEDPPPAE